MIHITVWVDNAETGWHEVKKSHKDTNATKHIRDLIQFGVTVDEVDVRGKCIGHTAWPPNMIRRIDVRRT